MATSYINNLQPNIKEITWKELHHANRSSGIMPFKITLGETEPPLLCDKLVRIMPGKRIVAFGTWGEHLVVAKLFFGERAAKRHYDQELSGIQTLLNSGVPTPRLLYHGTALKKRIHIFLFEHLVDSRNLADLWQERMSIEEQVPLMHAMIIELATQHVLGIVQKDLHLKNFLFKENQIFTLDGGSIETFHEPLPRKASLEHLALFFSQLGVGTEKLHLALFNAYARARGWIIRPRDTQFLQKTIKKRDKLRWHSYQEKIMRNCSAFAKIRKPTSAIMYDREYYSAEFLHLLTNPEHVFTLPTTTILKAGRSSTVVKIIVDGEFFVVKRYNIKGPWHWFRRSLRVTRAAESWRLANLLRLFGIATARPVAFIEKRFLNLRSKSYFIMEYVDGIHLDDFFTRCQDEAYCEKVAKRVVVLINNLNQLRVTHGDLKVSNLLLDDDRPVILDLDGMTEHVTQGQANRATKNDIQRFMLNWQSRPKIKTLFEKLWGHSDGT